MSDYGRHWNALSRPVYHIEPMASRRPATSGGERPHARTVYPATHMTNGTQRENTSSGFSRSAKHNSWDVHDSFSEERRSLSGSEPPTPEKDELQINDLRRMIHVMEELKNVDMREALNIYEKLMKKTSNSEELDREKRYFSKKNKDEMEMASNRHAEVEATERQMKEIMKKYENLKKENDKLTKDKDRLKHALEQYTGHLKEVDKRDKEYEAEIKSVKQELGKKEKELEMKQSDLNAALKDKNEALTRLSREMGTKLNDNNPGIADLSDPNRATKLAEKYNELYDNQWTDALEGLLKVYTDEEDAIKKLLCVFQDCYSFCVKAGKQQLDSLKGLLKTPLSAVPRQAWSSSFTDDLSNDRTAKTINRMLRDSRKLMAEEAITDVTKCYMQESRSKLKHVDEAFVKKCVELCWMMNVQQPPVVIGEECAVGSAFDGNNFKEYTNSGTTVAFTVWLPVYLHKDGPLLCKGVAQPVKKPKKPISPRTRDDPVYPDTYSTRDKSRTYTKTSGHAYRDTDSYDRNYDRHTTGRTNYETTVVSPKSDFDTDLYGSRGKDKNYTSPVSKAFVNRNYEEMNLGEYDRNKKGEMKTNTSSNAYDSGYKQHQYGFGSTSSRTRPDPTPVYTATNDVVEYDPYGNPVRYNVVMRSGIEYAVYCDKYYALDGFRRALNLSKTYRK